MTHTATGPQAFHILSARNKMRAVLGNPCEVNQLSRKETIKIVLLAKLIRLGGKLAKLLTIQIRLWINYKKWASQLVLFHTDPLYPKHAYKTTSSI
jgi:hypothetical protein